MEPFQFATIAFSICSTLFLIFMNKVLRIHRLSTSVEKSFQRIIYTAIVLFIGEVIIFLAVGNTTAIGFLLHKIGMSISLIGGFLCFWASANYVYTYMSERIQLSNQYMVVINIVCSIMIGLIIYNQFHPIIYLFDGNNLYHRGQLFIILYLLSIVYFGVTSMILYKASNQLSKHELNSFLSYIAIPAVGIVIQAVFPSWGVQYLGLIVAIALLYINIQNEYASSYHRSLDMLEDSKERMARLQIKPHFLYNTLNTIRYLAKHNTEDAVYAIDSFCSFLRANLHMVENENLIHVTKEIEYVKQYLEIEKLRYQDMMRIEYDLNCQTFYLPPLCIQPIVENAVKHGLAKSRDGGEIRISTWEEVDEVMICIEDTGVGFDLEAYQDSKSIGLRNIQKRLNLLCNGEIQIKSELGVGTNVMIKLPKGGKEK